MNFLSKETIQTFQGLAAHPRYEHAHAYTKGVADESEN
jgi:hypothetical protein